MEVLKILKEAIKLRKPIIYEYQALGRARGLRYGNPHAIFISTSGNKNIDIYKTDGVSTNSSKLPGWREYNIKNIISVKILHELSEFEIALGYKPHAERYNTAITKIG